MVAGAMDESRGRTGARRASRNTSSAVRLSVLVVEDHPVHRQIECMILETLGCYVTVASDGLEALEATRRTNFDLVILDRHMPRCNGDAAALTIRATPGPSQRSMIVCCSTDLPTDPIALLYDEVLAKPLTSSAAAELIQRARCEHITSLAEPQASSDLAPRRAAGRR